jgi:exonuclease VII small subunit
MQHLVRDIEKKLKEVQDEMGELKVKLALMERHLWLANNALEESLTYLTTGEKPTSETMAILKGVEKTIRDKLEKDSKA